MQKRGGGVRWWGYLYFLQMQSGTVGTEVGNTVVPDLKGFCSTRESRERNCAIQENFDKRKKKAQITFPLRHFFPLKVVK
jgi:hypothetical protein